MTHKYGDRVKETTTSTGTGNLTLAGAAEKHVGFDQWLANDDVFHYAVVHQTLNEWEVGLAKYVSATPAIQRLVILATSNDTPGSPTQSPVTFSAGTKDVFITVPAAAVDVHPQTFEARLTLETGVPLSTTDQTAKTTLYLTPYKGNRISIYDGYMWWGYKLTADLSLSLAGYIKGVTYDIFVNDNGAYWGQGPMSLVSYPWKKVTASNNPAAGSSVVINIADTGTPALAVGQRVTVKDGTNSEVAYITAVVTNTSITVASLANSYTTPDIFGFRERQAAYGIVYQDGVPTRNGSNGSDRYVGSITISGATTGQTEDSAPKRLVWNYENRVQRQARYNVPTASWTYSTATWRQMNNDAANQLELTCGIAGQSGLAHASTNVYNNTTTPRLVAFGIGNNVKTSMNTIWSQGGPTSDQYFSIQAFSNLAPYAGFNYFALMENGNGTDTQTWVGNGANTQIGFVWAC